MTTSVAFWNALQTHGDATALIDVRTDRTWSYAALNRCVRRVANDLARSARALVFLFLENDAAGIVCYLGSLTAGHTLYLCPSKIDSTGAAALIEWYKPEIILWRTASPGASVLDKHEVHADVGSYHQLRRKKPTGAPLHDDLALLLSTSASTASAKSVRLSLSNLAVSAFQVTDALGLTPGDRALACLPFSYVYGLSVLNSHLHAGASLVLNDRSVSDKAFWRQAISQNPTSVSAVSLTLSYLRSLQIAREDLPSLRTITHSGDPLDRSIFEWLFEKYMTKGVAVYPMYGQTEACGRISVLPPECLPERFGSVGKPVRCGRLSVGRAQEVVFHGPNVMMGYAASRNDLSLGDSMNGVLHTGDTGYLDEGGYLYLTGRLSRYYKVFGRRISLDDVEAHFSGKHRVAAIGRDGRVVLFFEGGTSHISRLLWEFSVTSRLPPQCLEVRELSKFPRTESGKVAYSVLQALK